MAAIKPLEVSSDKWSRRAAVAGEDYKAGVMNPRTAWDTAASAADATYRAAVTAAANAGRFASGIRKAGVQRWRDGAVNKGPQRFSEGVAMAVGEWQRGFAPHQAAINSLSLPPRGPVGSPQNLQRVAAIATALRAVKTQAK